MRVGCSSEDSNSAATCFIHLFVLCSSPRPPWEKRVVRRYVQRFRCGWNPCVPVWTLSSPGIFTWPTSHKSNIPLKVVACVPYHVTCFHFSRTSRAKALTMSPLISPRPFNCWIRNCGPRRISAAHWGTSAWPASPRCILDNLLQL